MQTVSEFAYVHNTSCKTCESECHRVSAKPDEQSENGNFNHNVKLMI